MKKDLTVGKPIQVLLSFAFPLLCGNLFQQFYSMVDTAIVGKYLGAKALAAVGSTGSINFLIIGFMSGISGGFSVIVAQYYGAQDIAGIRRVLGTILHLTVGMSAVFTVFSAAFAGQILHLMHSPDDLFENAYIYIFIIFLGIPATMLYNTLSGTLRALGDSRTPLIFLIISAFINVALDLLFILGFGWGVAGAALATVAAQLCSGILCLVYICKKLPEIRLSKDDLHFRPALAFQLLFVGIPMALQFSITAAGTIIVQSATNTLGSGAVAAVTAADHAQNFLVSPMQSIGLCLATYCGQNLGAGKLDRIKKGYWSAVLIGMIFCLAAMPISAFLGRYIALLFLDSSETAILADVRRFLIVQAIFYPSLQLVFIARNAIQGLGYSIPAMAAGVFELAGRSVCAFWLVKPLGFVGICISSPIAWVAAIAFLLPTYHIVYHILCRRLKGGAPAPGIA